MFERFTSAARESVVQAQLEARDRGDDSIGTEHVLLGVLWNADGVTRSMIDDVGLTYSEVRPLLESSETDEVLGKFGIDMTEVRRRVEAEFGPGALDGGGRRSKRGHIRFSRNAKKSLELALREAIRLGHNYIGVEHILLGLTRIPGSGAGRLIAAVGLEPGTVHDQLDRQLRKAA